MQKRGLPFIEKGVLASLRGERAFLGAPYLVAAALFPVGPVAEAMNARVLQDLCGGSEHFQHLATYAAAYVAWRNEEVNLLLAERVLEGSGGYLLLEAAKDVASIRADTRCGGVCRRCQERGQEPAALPAADWLVELVPGRNRNVV